MPREDVHAVVHVAAIGSETDYVARGIDYIEGVGVRLENQQGPAGFQGVAKGNGMLRHTRPIVRRVGGHDFQLPYTRTIGHEQEAHDFFQCHRLPKTVISSPAADVYTGEIVQVDIFGAPGCDADAFTLPCPVGFFRLNTRV